MAETQRRAQNQGQKAEKNEASNETPKEQQDNPQNQGGANMAAGYEGNAPAERDPDVQVERGGSEPAEGAKPDANTEAQRDALQAQKEVRPAAVPVDVARQEAHLRAQEATPQGVHTPTEPLGQPVDYARPVTAVVPGAGVPTNLQPANAEEAAKVQEAARQGANEPLTIEVAPPAPVSGGPVVSTSPGGRLEVAAPAPLPRPEDPSLVRGTEDAFEPTGRDGQQQP